MNESFVFGAYAQVQERSTTVTQKTFLCIILRSKWMNFRELSAATLLIVINIRKFLAVYI